MINYCLDETFGQSYLLKFETPVDDPKSVHLVEDAMLEYKGDQFFISDLGKLRRDDGTYVTVEAEAAWVRLADIKKPGSLVITGLQPTGGLAYILGFSGGGWTVSGEFDSFAPTYNMEVTDATILDLCWQWAKICGCELSFDATEQRHVWISAQVGVNRGLSFRYRRNLETVKRRAIPPSATRVYAYGRDGLTIADQNGGVEYIEDYTYYTDQGLSLPVAQQRYRKDYLISDDTFIDSLSLYNAAVLELAARSQPIVTYEMEVVDLSKLTGIVEGDFKCGDTVGVQDDVLGFDVDARVSRRLRYPYEPFRDRVELTYGAIQLPDPSVSNSRGNSTTQWELFQSRNRQTIRKVRNGSSILHRLVLNHIEGAQWVVGYKISAIGVGSGNLTISADNDTEVTALWPDYVIPFTNGQKIEWDFTYGEQDIPAGQTAMVIRAQSDTANAGMNIAIDSTAFWVLARGTTRQGPTLANSVRYDYTGSVQSFIVPDDVTEILVEAHGACGESIASALGVNYGYGGEVTATIYVNGGDVYDVYVGGKGTAAGGAGWPNGGSGVIGNNNGHAGGGSSSVQPNTGGNFLATLANAIIVAGAGGGAGSADLGPFDPPPGPGPRREWYAGSGSFYGGTSSDAESRVGSGGTQSAGGTGAGGAPTDGSFGTGGPGAVYGPVGISEGGGGGGGWYGGGAADKDPSGGGSYGGGGGSGWVGSTGYDIDVADAENNDHGFIIISWSTPDE